MRTEDRRKDIRRLRFALRKVKDIRVFRRALAVLAVLEGASAREAERRSGIDHTRVYYWVQRYRRHHHIADLEDKARRGRPRSTPAWLPQVIRSQIRKDPRSFGYATSVWTVALLSTHLKKRYDVCISQRTLRRRMRDLGLRWKRPRHVYATKDPNRTQKKAV